MATQILEAVFQNGTFRPVSAVPSLAEGQQVRLVIEVEESNDVLAVAGAVFEGLSEGDMEDVERIALNRRNFFKASAE